MNGSVLLPESKVAYIFNAERHLAKDEPNSSINTQDE
jgi:hypothetical protein